MPSSLGLRKKLVRSNTGATTDSLTSITEDEGEEKLTLTEESASKDKDKDKKKKGKIQKTTKQRRLEDEVVNTGNAEGIQNRTREEESVALDGFQFGLPAVVAVEALEDAQERKKAEDMAAKVADMLRGDSFMKARLIMEALRDEPSIRGPIHEKTEIPKLILAGASTDAPFDIGWAHLNSPVKLHFEDTQRSNGQSERKSAIPQPNQRRQESGELSERPGKYMGRKLREPSPVLPPRSSKQLPLSVEQDDMHRRPQKEEKDRTFYKEKKDRTAHKAKQGHTSHKEKRTGDPIIEKSRKEINVKRKKSERDDKLFAKQIEDIIERENEYRWRHRFEKYRVPPPPPPSPVLRPMKHAVMTGEHAREGGNRPKDCPPGRHGVSGPLPVCQNHDSLHKEACSSPIVPTGMISERLGIQPPRHLESSQTSSKNIVTTSDVSGTRILQDGLHPLRDTLHRRPTIADVVAGMRNEGSLGSPIELPPSVPRIPFNFATGTMGMAMPLSSVDRLLTPPVGNAFAGSGFWASSSSHSTPTVTEKAKLTVKVPRDSVNSRASSTLVPSVASKEMSKVEESPMKRSLKSLISLDNSMPPGSKQPFPEFAPPSNMDSREAFEHIREILLTKHALRLLGPSSSKAPNPKAPMPWTRVAIAIKDGPPPTPRRVSPNPQLTWIGLGYDPDKIPTPKTPSRPSASLSKTHKFSFRGMVSKEMLATTPSQSSLGPAEATPRISATPKSTMNVKTRRNAVEPPILDKSFEEALEISAEVVRDMEAKICDESSEYHDFSELVNNKPGDLACKISEFAKREAQVTVQDSIKNMDYLEDVSSWKFPIESTDPKKMFEFDTVLDRQREAFRMHRQQKVKDIDSMGAEHRLIYATKFYEQTRDRHIEESTRHEERMKTFNELGALREAMDLPEEDSGRESIKSNKSTSDDSDKTITYFQGNIFRSIKAESDAASLDYLNSPLSQMETEIEAKMRRRCTSINVGRLRSPLLREERETMRVINIDSDIATDWSQILDKGMEKEMQRQTEALARQPLNLRSNRHPTPNYEEIAESYFTKPGSTPRRPGNTFEMDRDAGGQFSDKRPVASIRRDPTFALGSNSLERRHDRYDGYHHVPDGSFTDQMHDSSRPETAFGLDRGEQRQFSEPTPVRRDAAFAQARSSFSASCEGHDGGDENVDEYIPPQRQVGRSNAFRRPGAGGR